MKGDYEQVGEVAAIWRYLLKATGGESLPACKLGWHGLADDRRFRFHKLGSHSGFPWLTIRDYPLLALYKARQANPDDPNSSLRVRTPHGIELPVDSPELLAELEAASGERLALIKHSGGIFDAMALSIITRQSVSSFGKLLGKSDGDAPDVERFRPNIVIEATDGRAFPEDRWVGELLVFGDGPDAAQVRANGKDTRCMVVNVHPHTGRQNPEYLRTLVQERGQLLGVYGSTERTGLVRVGEPVYLLRK